MHLIRCLECFDYAQVETGDCPNCGSNRIRNMETEMEN
jgi:rRNA maturation endonuclease Nob1